MWLRANVRSSPSTVVSRLGEDRAGIVDQHVDARRGLGQGGGELADFGERGQIGDVDLGFETGMLVPE